MDVPFSAARARHALSRLFGDVIRDLLSVGSWFGLPRLGSSSPATNGIARGGTNCANGTINGSGSPYFASMDGRASSGNLDKTISGISA